MKSKRSLLLLAALVVAAGCAVRSFARGRFTRARGKQSRELFAAMQAAYASTLAAFDPRGDADDLDQRDARAAADSESLQRAFEAAKPLLNGRIAPMATALVEAVADAQLQIMAFAINRKNRGLPDAAQTEAEGEDRQAFRRQIEPLFKDLKAALS